MLSSAITKNLISNKNLVFFKRWDGIKDEKFEYYGGSLKNPSTILKTNNSGERLSPSPVTSTSPRSSPLDVSDNF